MVNCCSFYKSCWGAPCREFIILSDNTLLLKSVYEKVAVLCHTHRNFDGCSFEHGHSTFIDINTELESRITKLSTQSKKADLEILNLTKTQTELEEELRNHKEKVEELESQVSDQKLRIDSQHMEITNTNSLLTDQFKEIEKSGKIPPPSRSRFFIKSNLYTG